MPTKRHGKVRRLLKQGLAKVVRREPFTIQLLYDTTTYTQPVTVGVDIGSKTVGISAITNKQELLSMEVELRQDIKKLLLKRREYRSFRRFDKVRYKNQIGIIHGLRSSGYFDIRTLSGEKIHSSVKWSNLKLLEKAKTLILERREQRIPLHLKEDGVSCAGL
jgi:hypothetical protein